jgi:sporulation protein YlmC with PRC-barrel domain
MKARTLTDMPVVSMADGAQVGNVEEMLIDIAELRVAALRLRAAGGPSILPFAAVRSIGADAVMVESTAATEGAAGQTARDGLRGLGDLLGLPVLNGEGEILGTVTDLEVAPEDGRLQAIAVHRGGILGIGGTHLAVATPNIRMIGPKLITVDLPAVEPAAAPTAR